MLEDEFGFCGSKRRRSHPPQPLPSVSQPISGASAAGHQASDVSAPSDDEADRDTMDRRRKESERIFGWWLNMAAANWDRIHTSSYSSVPCLSVSRPDDRTEHLPTYLTSILTGDYLAALHCTSSLLFSIANFKAHERMENPGGYDNVRQQYTRNWPSQATWQFIQEIHLSIRIHISRLTAHIQT